MRGGLFEGEVPIDERELVEAYTWFRDIVDRALKRTTAPNNSADPLRLSDIQQSLPSIGIDETMSLAEVARAGRARKAWRMLAAAPDIKQRLQSHPEDIEGLLVWMKSSDAYPENTPEYQAAEWLEKSQLLLYQRARVSTFPWKDTSDPNGFMEFCALVTELVDLAERNLGRLQERILWRTTAIPGTETKRSPKGKSPEQLAVARLRSDKPFAEHNEGREKAFTKRQRAAERWQSELLPFVMRYQKEHPEASDSQIGRDARKELVKLRRTRSWQAAQGDDHEGDEQTVPSERTLRAWVGKLGST